MVHRVEIVWTRLFSRWVFEPADEEREGEGIKGWEGHGAGGDGRRGGGRGGGWREGVAEVRRVVSEKMPGEVEGFSWLANEEGGGFGADSRFEVSEGGGG